MTLLIGLLAITGVLLALYALVWARWRVRDRRRRRNRMVERQARRDELERVRRQLRLRVQATEGTGS